MSDIFKLIRKLTTPDRVESFCKAAQRILDTGTKNLIETGCYRGSGPDGSSTLVLAFIAHAAGTKLHSYELDPNNIACARAALAKQGMENVVEFHQGDSITNLALRTEPIGFAYLDSYDCGLDSHLKSQEHQLAELEAVLPRLEKRATILLDDHVPIKGGKTRLSMRKLQARGFLNQHCGYQLLYTTEDSTHIQPHDFAMLCAHSVEYVPVALHSIYHNFCLYCAKHGYDLRIERDIRPRWFDTNSHANGFSWSRMEAMLDLVRSGKFEWVWVLGADALITNMTVTLQSFADIASSHHHIIICGEREALVQADSFLVRGSKRGADLLHGILASYNHHKHHRWVENQAMIDTLPFWRDMALILPQHLLNSYQYHMYEDPHKGTKDCYGNRGNWEPKDFVLHLPGMSYENRIRLFKEHEPFVVK